MLCSVSVVAGGTCGAIRGDGVPMGVHAALVLSSYRSATANWNTGFPDGSKDRNAIRRAFRQIGRHQQIIGMLSDGVAG